MNSYINSYIQQAATFFPIMGNPERSYLTQLSFTIADHFADGPPDSLDAIYQVFGLPQSIVKDYITHSDVQYVVKRIRMRKLIRSFVASVLLVVLLFAFTASVHWGLKFKAIHDTADYIPPTYSMDENGAN